MDDWRLIFQERLEMGEFFAATSSDELGSSAPDLCLGCSHSDMSSAPAADAFQGVH